MKIMYVANNPDGAESLQIEREINDLQEHVASTAGVEPIDLRTYSALPIARFTATVARVQPDVLHIAAHGVDGAVVLGDADRGDVRLDGKALANLLSVLPNRPRLVVLNACSSNEMAEDLVKAGAADFVIGTDAPISNIAARAMAAALYQRLAEAASLENAFRVAATHLDLIDGGMVKAHLHAAGVLGDAARVQLVDPFRLMACFPKVDEFLRNRLIKPDKKFRPEYPEVLFGVAGSPSASRQTIIFTDDETVTGDSLEDARSWIIESQPVNGEIWLNDSRPYYGDMNWFAAVTTTDGRVVSSASKMTAALQRYYFDEQWKGVLPEAIADVIRRSIELLKNEGGGRRGR